MLAQCQSVVPKEIFINLPTRAVPPHIVQCLEVICDLWDSSRNDGIVLLIIRYASRCVSDKSEERKTNQSHQEH